MTQIYWINIILLIFCFSCTSTRKISIMYREPPSNILTIKPIIVRTMNNNANHAKSILINELRSSGYEIIQDTDVTQKLINPFGVSQVTPTKDYTEILVSIELDDYTEDSRVKKIKVRLSNCNKLLKENQCTYRDSTKSQYNTTINRNGKIRFTIMNGGENPIIKESKFTAKNSGIIPSYPNGSLSQKIKNAISRKFFRYLSQTKVFTPDYEIDTMTADFIDSGIYEIASKRVNSHESGYKYYFTMGLIEETQKNYTGAKMYYSEGELNTERKDLFSNAIKRVEYFLVTK
jgi:hypothetical protein